MDKYWVCIVFEVEKADEEYEDYIIKKLGLKRKDEDENEDEDNDIT